MYTWPEEIDKTSDPIKEMEEAHAGLTLLRQAGSVTAVVSLTLLSVSLPLQSLHPAAQTLSLSLSLNYLL